MDDSLGIADSDAFRGHAANSKFEINRSIYCACIYQEKYREGKCLAQYTLVYKRDTLTATFEQPPVLSFTFYSLQSIKVKPRVY